MVSPEEMKERDCEHKWILVKNRAGATFDEVYLYCENCGKYIKKEIIHQIENY